MEEVIHYPMCLIQMGYTSRFEVDFFMYNVREKMILAALPVVQFGAKDIILLFSFIFLRMLLKSGISTCLVRALYIFRFARKVGDISSGS